MSVKTGDIEITLESRLVKGGLVKKGSVFPVTVKVKDKTFKVEKNYKDFKMLLYQLKKNHQELRDSKLPNKPLFSGKSEADLVKTREEAIMQLLRTLVTIKGISENDMFRAFFQLPSVSETAVESPNIFKAKDSEADTVFKELTIDSKKTVEDFDILKVIGKGSYGRVYLVRHKEDGKYFAMKVLEKKMVIARRESHHIMIERGVLMKNAAHPFLVGIHFSFQTSEKLYFILDYVNGGELFFHLQQQQTFEEAAVRFYTAELGEAIGYLHGLNIIYRDLKPENILLDKDGHIRLTDFGLSKEMTHDAPTTTTFCGTYEYMAPEILEKKPYGRAVDWWAFGSVVYELLLGLPPFYNNNQAEMSNSIRNAEVTFMGKISLVAKALILALLNKDPVQRLGSSQEDWNEIKAHTFFRSINFDDIINKRIKPPFNPDVSSETDLKNIDEEFLGEEITESILTSKDSPLADRQDANQFSGFTYIQKSGFD